MKIIAAGNKDYCTFDLHYFVALIRDLKARHNPFAEELLKRVRVDDDKAVVITEGL